jgi:hypothetical protein
MLANTLFIIVAIGVPVLLAAGALLLIDRMRPSRRPMGSPQVAPTPPGFDEALAHPDWAFYERHLQRPSPEALRKLYADENLIMLCNFEYGEESINCFEPIREDNVLDTSAVVGFDIVPIATSYCGDPVYLRPGPVEPDRVYVTHHDGGDTEVLAESAAVFLEVLQRRYNSGKE